jgi:hypothetical protein
MIHFPETMSTHPLDHIKMKTAPTYMQAEVAEHNLKKAEEFEHYGTIADQVDAAMAEQDRIWNIRTEAGWAFDEGGWYAPDGTHESDWDGEFPEEKSFSV